MAHLPFLLQQSMTSLDELQATMEEVQPLLWFTAGLFVVTLLLTAVLIFRKQHQKKKKEKDPEINHHPPQTKKKKASPQKEKVQTEETSTPEPAPEPEVPKEEMVPSSPHKDESFLEEPTITEPPPSPSIHLTPPSVKTSKEEVTSLVDAALKETKSREENLEAIKKRLQELGVNPKESEDAFPSKNVVENPLPEPATAIQEEVSVDTDDDMIEEAEVIYVDAEPLFEPVVQTMPSEETQELPAEETIPSESMTWSFATETASDATQNEPQAPPTGSMLPQQIKTFADWLRDFK